MENLQIDPPTLTVRSGDRIRWVNKDLFPHTATGRAFDSGSIAPNASWTFVATQPGEYPYGCTFHPTMKAELIVR
jgi:plastocyanin